MINLLQGIESTASALTAERIRMEVVSQNLANLNTTRGLNGKPYQRQQVVFETVMQNRLQEAGNPTGNLIVGRVENDKRPPRLVARPGHPDADAQGMVSMPNINMHEEMADLMTASRVFEANLAVIKSAKSMVLQTLAIGRRR